MKMPSLIFAFFLSLTSPAVFAQPKAPDVVITDMNLSFFSSEPKLPWGNDPFLKQPGYASVPAEPEKFTLGGIMYSEDRPVAVVNGKTVHVGDEVGNRWVTEIGDNYVLLKNGASEIEINLPPLRSTEFEEGELEQENQE